MVSARTIAIAAIIVTLAVWNLVILGLDGHMIAISRDGTGKSAEAFIMFTVVWTILALCYFGWHHTGARSGFLKILNWVLLGLTSLFLLVSAARLTDLMRPNDCGNPDFVKNNRVTQLGDGDNMGLLCRYAIGLQALLWIEWILFTAYAVYSVIFDRR